MVFPSLNVSGLFPRRGNAGNVHVGVDVGQRRLKVVVASAERGGFTVRHAMDEPLVNGVFVDGKLADVALAGQQLGQLLRERRVRNARVAVVVPASEGLRRMQMGALAREDMLKALRVAVASQTSEPNPLSLAVDCHDLGSVADSDRRDLVVAVARRDLVRAFQRIIAEAGFTPNLVTVAPIALANAFEVCWPDRRFAGSRTVLVHGGHTGVLCVVLESGVPVATHSVLTGVQALVDRALGAQASALPQYVEDSLFNPGAAPVNPAVFQDWLKRIAQEIRRAVAGARRGNAGAEDDLAEVWLSGGIARVSGVEDGLSAALGCKVNVFDPWACVEAEAGLRASVCGPALAVAVGLALESASLATEAKA